MTARYRMMTVALAAFVGLAGLFMNERPSMLARGALVSAADAVIGRPATPMSYAGVARRTTRRAVVATGAAAAAGAAATCVQVANAYGQIVTRC